ncbi:MAG: hypothetical protein ABMA02_01110 [Saprospiraceae bacterium]
MKTFRDEKQMKPDISLPKLIREGLENSEYRKKTRRSKWHELQVAYR